MNDGENIFVRNARVEADKAWETSWTRRCILAAGTYFAVGMYLTFLHVESAWFHALVPPMAYILSTLTLPFFKKMWLENIYQNKK
ncbi:MAG: hypothetical protein KDI13_07200 [Alphaproteobacteria bacterium]|nr:hypothetical protein [Alphaproteobacteria bacterium]